MRTSRGERREVTGERPATRRVVPRATTSPTRAIFIGPSAGRNRAPAVRADRPPVSAAIGAAQSARHRDAPVAGSAGAATSAATWRRSLSSRARGRGAAIAARCDDADVRSRREHQADRALVAAYHEARLGKLVEPSPKPSTASAPAQHDALDVDEVLHQYQRAAREL